MLSKPCATLVAGRASAVLLCRAVRCESRQVHMQYIQIPYK